jgi:hypothetical protein
MIAWKRIALALFGFTMIGADGCNVTLPWDPGTPDSSPPPPAVCLTDPPIGCDALCIVLDTTGTDIPPPPTTPIVSPDCSEGGGPLAAQFITDAQTILTCDPATYGPNMSYVVFPTEFSLTPQVAQTGICTMPPVPPPTESLANLMNPNDL